MAKQPTVEALIHGPEAPAVLKAWHQARRQWERLIEEAVKTNPRALRRRKKK